MKGADLRKESMQESWREVSGKKVQGVEATNMRTSKEYRKDSAIGHRADGQGKIVNRFPTVGMSKEFVNKQRSPF